VSWSAWTLTGVEMERDLWSQSHVRKELWEYACEMPTVKGLAPDETTFFVYAKGQFREYSLEEENTVALADELGKVRRLLALAQHELDRLNAQLHVDEDSRAVVL
jgi:hypothetical protein